MNSKIWLREEMRKSLENLTTIEFDQISQLATLNLNKFIKDSFPSTQSLIFGVFLKLKKEVYVMEHLIEYQNIQWAYPILENEVMSFAVALDKKNPPSGPWLKTKAEIVNPDVLIIPGLAFDLEGNRLGRGKGFYDKFLEKFRGIKMGLCAEFQLTQSLETEQHDIKMNYIITEKRLIKI